MALGEYVSVSSQRDTERALLARGTPNSPSSRTGTRRTDRDLPAKGLTQTTARQVALELTEDAFAAHADAELGSTRTP